MIERRFLNVIILFLCITNVNAQGFVLKADSYRHYIDSFNINDEELYKGSIPNNGSWAFLKANIPLFDCPDKMMEETYYFRWWTYRKHIKNTPTGYVITEFLPPVPWAGKYNAISCPAAFHFSEGRWLHDRKYLDQYADYWFNGGGNPRSYSFWSAHAIYNYCLVSNDFSIAIKLLPALISNYSAWEEEHLDSTGLYWQVDGNDGMELSVCGEETAAGYRATINAYMYGDAMAIANIAARLHQSELARQFQGKAGLIKKKVQQNLWDQSAEFYKVRPRRANASLCSARELHGYTPWYFNMADPENNSAWKYLMDSSFFYAPFGLTSVEQNHPGFKISYEGHECQWNGPSWPYATSITLTALSNLLTGSKQAFVGKKDYLKLLTDYTKSQHLKREDGRVVPWIDENLNPFTGDWIARTRLKSWDNGTWSMEKGGKERGKDYNHSLYCDLVISGLIGIKPQAGNLIIIDPLVPDGTWDYFCLDNILYHGKIITVLYDSTGARYRKGKGFLVYVNGILVSRSTELRKLKIAL